MGFCMRGRAEGSNPLNQLMSLQVLLIGWVEQEEDGPGTDQLGSGSERSIFVCTVGLTERPQELVRSK